MDIVVTLNHFTSIVYSTYEFVGLVSREQVELISYILALSYLLDKVVVTQESPSIEPWKKTQF